MPDTPDPKPGQPQGQPPRKRRVRRVSSKDKKAVSPEESQLQKWELAKHEQRRKKKKKTEVGQLNLTSMIDVIFLLLIYFVVTANFVENEGVLIAKLPTGSGPAKAPDDIPPANIDLNIRSFEETGCIVEVGVERFRSFRDLTAHLIAIQDNPAKGRQGYQPVDSPVIIRPGGEVRWNHVVDAFNSSFTAGYTNISFAQTGGGG